MSLPPGLRRFKSIRDPIKIFGHIEFTFLEMQIIDSTYFQATKHVKQLGFVTAYDPSANHSRFEQMSETCYLAGECLYQISRNQPELARDFAWNSGDSGESGDSVESKANTWTLWFALVRLSGLLHDLGHVVYSHAFESFLESHPEVSARICSEYARP